MEKDEIDSYVKAGEIAREVKEFARGLIGRGVKLIDVAEAVDVKIVELGGEVAFPVNLSLNEVAAHYTPEPGDDKVAEGILKVDIGVAVDGYIADTAFSVDLTSDGEHKDMIELNEKILSEISDKIFRGVGVSGCRGVGLKVKDVGEVAMGTLEAWDASRENRNQKIENRGAGVARGIPSKEGTSVPFSSGKFAIIKGLSGHVLGRNKIHAGLTISNYRNDNVTELKDVAFAIEPFVTTGVGDIYEGPVGGIYVLQEDRAVRDRDARRVLGFVRDEYNGRPFCLRFLIKEFGDLSLNKLRFILKGMVKDGVLYEYPMLIEKSRKPVSQFENTFLVCDGKVVCTTN